MPKKVSRSGFYYFMLDYKDNQERSGRKFPNGLRDVQADQKCSEAWSVLSVEEKARYNRRAKDKIQKRGKLTGAGESVELLEKQKQMQMEYETKMKQVIDHSIMEADQIGNLDTISFYFIHVNHFYTKVSLDENWTDYIPAEYAVVEFSLKCGIKRIHHQIIKTDIQPGYTREYIEHSDSTHKLLCNLSESENDYAVMYDNLVEFLKFDKSSKKLPPLYTVKNMMTIVPCLLERMTTAVDSDIKIFDLYSLEYLFGALMGITNSEYPDNMSRSILATVHLEKDEYLWTPNIECSFHSNIEGTGPYCSQSIVKQWVFTIADYCCSKLSIELKPGFHCPVEDLTCAIASLSIQQSRPSLKTGASVGYGLTTGRKDDERCRNQNDSLKIIDYGENSQSPVPIPLVPTTKPRIPDTMATVFAPSNEVPTMNDDNFPAIGGRGRPRPGKINATKPGVGRGRGIPVIE